jgi:mRNA-degrading endonuclease YafQ of YafQ-DinJ toxin-antitoxin module
MRALSVSKSAKRKIEVFLKKHPALRSKVERIIGMLLRDTFSAGLDTHKLSGKLGYLYAASITYEYRFVFYFDIDTVYIVNIGSHDEVY